ncbi:CPBP family intramembrane glutamic endopeptidase [Pedobacter cryotolerans]|uniref:CPBP family intramembrane metalloprotease n=1 Tax=Pedobacter cryotolerans TaxID=2571270 RepID=A0A4U1C9D6_9SPHI|nr:CPBP family intramembrane glutamic endopeptidase [Pedobacter cryotolerans]TKC03099.1 CPBP family intramembrane metalloprotease [Pedobacter cryotolerans]
MQLSQPVREENHPLLQLLILGVNAAIGLGIFLVIGFIICVLIYGLDLIHNMDWITGKDLKYIGALKILVTAQQIGFFLVPAIVLAIFEGKKPQRFYGFKTPKIDLLGIVFLLMLFSVPLMGWINEQNMNMHLPKFLSDLEKWMTDKESEAAITTKAILAGTSVGALVINLLVIAVTPAICEELIFRGGLQRTLGRWFKNPHVAIWTSAIIFSTIHFQFFGFFPRMFLGAAFGYIYFWTGSLWYPMFAHFINNGYAVVIAWYMQRNKIPIEKADDLNIAWYGYIISAILTIALFWFLKKKSANERPMSETEINSPK